MLMKSLMPDVRETCDADVIVGAPFEDGGHGAAYVYHGCASATGLVDQFVQKLTPASLDLPALRGFAYSFASRMDIDDNRYPGRAASIEVLIKFRLRRSSFITARILRQVS